MQFLITQLTATSGQLLARDRQSRGFRLFTGNAFVRISAANLQPSTPATIGLPNDALPRYTPLSLSGTTDGHRTNETAELCCVSGVCGNPALPESSGRGIQAYRVKWFWVGHSGGRFAAGLRSDRGPGPCPAPGDTRALRKTRRHARISACLLVLRQSSVHGPIASVPRSPVRMRTQSSSGRTKILPSPI